MEKIEFGEIIELEDGKEFICFAREVEVEGELAVEMVGDPGLKQKLFGLFQEKFGGKR